MPHPTSFPQNVSPWHRLSRLGVFSILTGPIFAAISFAAEAPESKPSEPAERLKISGVYPHLAYYNKESECGTGAVVPWANHLWVITYGPHLPMGSSDRLYQISESLDITTREESVGGTPANRFIHRETQQMLIGPYVIDQSAQVRVIPPKKMPGRLTGNARHLTDPENKVYYATMEEGLYEVDLKTLEVRGLILDGNGIDPKKLDMKYPATFKSKLPGYHGKGLYSGQGKLIYANNGEQDPRVGVDPTIPSGSLAEWDTPGEDWRMIRRNQFTEVTGPGGLYGNPNPETDPIWSVGWDDRSLILATLFEGKWYTHRLPKGSHSYDGSHGWNTEWPRIRDIEEDHLLMTMHGTFWKFPADFTPKNSAGIQPRSNYLKVIGDFAKWQGEVVFGCDDTAASEFLNSKRKIKGSALPARQSQSNLWFVAPEQLDHLGPVIGRGAVWKNDEVKADQVSDPYLFAGYDLRGLHLTHQSDQPVTFQLEVDLEGNGTWTFLKEIVLPAKGYQWIPFPSDQKGTWIRLVSKQDAEKVTAFFHYRNHDKRSPEHDPIFEGIAKPGQNQVQGGLLHARGNDLKTLRLVQNDLTVYDLDEKLIPTKVEDTEGAKWQKEHVAIPTGVIEIDAASVLYVDDSGRRWRFPKGDPALDQEGPLGPERLSREVCTERDLLNLHGTFYELPAENAGGFAKVRPIATHNLRIKDYATYRGMLFFSGIAENASAQNNRIRRSPDGKMAVWAGTVDDLWKAGKPRGEGGPWKNFQVKANTPSDPYLMTAYDRKSLTLSHESKGVVKIRVEVDLTGSGDWVTYQTFEVPSGESVQHAFHEAFSAYWVRFTVDQDTVATAWLKYE